MRLLIIIKREFRHVGSTWKLLSLNWLVALVNKFVFVFFFLSLVALVWRWRLLPPQVPLWYYKPWGVEQLTSPYWLFILPLASILVYFANILISVYFTPEYLVFIQTLSLTSLLVSFLSFVTLVKILFIVT